MYTECFLAESCMHEGPAGCFLGTYTADFPCQELDELCLGGTWMVLKWGSANSSYRSILHTQFLKGDQQLGKESRTHTACIQHGTGQQPLQTE